MSTIKHAVESAASAAAPIAPAAPPVTVIAAEVLGTPLPVAIQRLTVIYMLILIAYQLHKWWREARDARDARKARGEGAAR